MIGRGQLSSTGDCLLAVHIASVIGIVVPLAVLSAWLLDIEFLKSVLSGSATMKPIAALCFILLSTALWLSASPPDAMHLQGRRAWSVACAALVCLVGAATLIEYALNIDFGFDDLLFASKLDAGIAHPERMSSATALCFLLLGAGLLLPRNRRIAAVAAELVTIAATLVSFIGLLGHLYGVKALYLVVPYSSMALHTIVLFLLLGIATLLASPERGLAATVFSPNVGGILARRVLPVAIVLPIVVGWLRLLEQRAGWYGTEVGLALFAAMSVLIFGVVVWLAARALNRIDVQRRGAELNSLRLLESLDQASEALMTLDLDGRITSWSAGATRLYGYEAREALGRIAPDLLVPGNQPQEHRRVLDRVRLDAGKAYEATRCTKSGQMLDVEISFAPMRDEQGKLLGQLSLSRDISARKRAEELRAHAAAIVESSDDAIVGSTTQGVITSWNAGAERLFGYTAHEAIGLDASVLLSPDHIEEERAILARVLKGERIDHFETLRRMRTGAAVAVSLTISPIRDGAGHIVGISKIARDITALKQVEQRLRDEEARLRVDITERKRAQEALAAERTLLRTLIDALPDVVFTKDLAGNFVLSNAAELAYLGVAEAELAGKSVFDFYPPELAQKYHDDDRQVLAGQPIVNREELSVDGTGKQSWFLTNKVPLRDRTGSIVGLVGISRDITQRQAMEQALRDSENRFRQLAESLPQLVWTCEPAGSCDYLSRQWVQYTGIAAEHQLGSGWLTQVHPDDHEGLVRAWNAAVGAGSHFRIEFRIRRYDGEYRWFDTRAVPLQAADGSVIKWIGSNTDIHEARAMREALQQQAMLIELAHDPIFVWDQAGDIVFWNRGCEQLYGYTRQEAIGHVGHELLETVFALSLEQLLRELERSQEWSGELQHTTKEGRHVTVSSRQQKVEVGGHSLILEANRDITERKRAEEYAVRAQKMEALGTLAGGIAHDFNNILLAIVGNTKLSKQDLPAEHPVQHSLGEIDKAAARATELVRRILAFSRQEAPRREILEFSPVVKEAIQLLRATLPAMIEIRFQPRASLARISADATQVHQIVMNLVTNSAHAIGSRKGLVEVRVEEVEVSREMTALAPDLQVGRYIRLAVSDDGSGMDKQTLERIFDPFFTTKAVGEGTGLGLSTVHGIVKRHDGAISVYSAKNQGTTFHVYFPAVEQAASTSRTEQVELPRGHGERLLYLDDEQALVHLAVRMLERLGYEVTGHTDPAQALAAFESEPQAFDVVVTDLSMPRMSGFVFVQALHAIRPDVPVVMTSGYLREQDQETAARIGIRELVLKPNSVEDLGRVVHRVLGDLHKPDDRSVRS